MNPLQHTITRKNFFKNKPKFQIHKSYLLSANSSIVLDDDPRSFHTGMMFWFGVAKNKNDLLFTIELYSWSNEKQTHVPLCESVWAEEGFGSGDKIPLLKNHYKNIIENLFSGLQAIKYLWELKNLLFMIENPTLNFHYKLLNLFSKEFLETFYKKHFENHPILNIPLLQKPLEKTDFGHLFLPDIVNGFYWNGIEVSVDLNESDIPLIEDMDSGEISKEEFMKRTLPLQ